MQPLQFAVPILDFLELIEGYVIFAILILVVANMVTRILAHNRHKKQADDDDDGELSRYAPHTVTTVLLILATMLFLVVEPHSGMITAIFVLGVFFTDFFEFEARRVEVRTNHPLERPKAAIFSSFLLLVYAAYVGLFFLIKDYWNMVI